MSVVHPVLKVVLNLNLKLLSFHLLTDPIREPILVIYCSHYVSFRREGDDGGVISTLTLLRPPPRGAAIVSNITLTIRLNPPKRSSLTVPRNNCTTGHACTCFSCSVTTTAPFPLPFPLLCTSPSPCSLRICLATSPLNQSINCLASSPKTSSAPKTKCQPRFGHAPAHSAASRQVPGLAILSAGPWGGERGSPEVVTSPTYWRP